MMGRTIIKQIHLVSSAFSGGPTDGHFHGWGMVLQHGAQFPVHRKRRCWAHAWLIIVNDQLITIAINIMHATYHYNHIRAAFRQWSRATDAIHQIKDIYTSQTCVQASCILFSINAVISIIIFRWKQYINFCFWLIKFVRVKK